MDSKQHADEVAAAYERWSYGEGYGAGKVDGSREGWRDGYTHGFDTGAEVGATRALLELEHVVGRERLQEMCRDSDHRIPGADGYLDYRARTTYEPVAERAEWRGTENGAELPTWDDGDEDGMDL